MKKYFRLNALALLAIFSLISGSAFAAVTHTDGDIYGDAFTVEDRNGNWTFASNTTVQGTMAVSGVFTSGLTPLTVIGTTPDTIGTVTAAKSGYTFVLDPSSTKPGETNLWLLTLPSATGNSTGLTYRFVTATGSTLQIKPANAGEVIKFGFMTPGQKLNSPASSGCSVVLVSNSSGSGKWYVASITTTPNNGVQWTGN